MQRAAAEDKRDDEDRKIFKIAHIEVVEFNQQQINDRYLFIAETGGCQSKSRKI